MSELNDFYYNEKWDKIVVFLRKSRLETLNSTYILSKIFSKLHEKNYVEDLYDILLIIAKYEMNVMKDEFKEGVRILLDTQNFEKVYILLNIFFEKNKKVEEYIVSLTLNACFKVNSNIDNCFKLILTFYEKCNDISHSFWQNAIENFIKLSYAKEANHLLKLYPIKYSYSETLFKSVIKEKIRYKQPEDIVEVLIFKFENKNNSDDIRAYENIFSILLEELTANFENIGQDLIDKVFSYILLKRFKIHDLTIENFLVKVAVSNIYNFAVVEKYLIDTDNMVTQKTITRIIEEYHKVKDYFNIINIIKLCKSNQIKVRFDVLMLKSDISMEVIKFMLENTDMSFDLSFLETLSVENQDYAKVSKSRSNRGEDKDLSKNLAKVDGIETNKLNNNFEDINSYKSKTDSSFLDINKIDKTTDEYEMI